MSVVGIVGVVVGPFSISELLKNFQKSFRTHLLPTFLLGLLCGNHLIFCCATGMIMLPEFRKKGRQHSPLMRAIIEGKCSTLKSFIPAESDVCSFDCDGHTPLHIAASYGQAEMVKYLFDCGFDVNAPNPFGSTPLYEAAIQGHNHVIFLLLNLGANVNSCDINGRSPLYVACYYGHFETVELLLSFEANVNHFDRKGISVVGVAAGRGFLNIVDLLFRNHANLIHTDHDGLVPMCIAALQGHVHIVRYLCQNGVECVHVYDNHGRTPIYAASQRGNLAVVQELYHNGADITIPDDIGRTPVCVAAFYNQIETLRYLCGLPECNVNHCDHHNRTALHSAASKGHDQIIEILCQHGANVHIRDHYGRTPLFIASEFHHHQCIELLCKYGASIDELDKNGCTPLCFAALSGSVDTLRFLVSCGADVNKKCGTDRTPIYCAASGGKAESVQILYENNADFTIADSKGRTPLYIAAIQGRVECLRLLCSYGCFVNCRTESGCTPLYAAALEARDEVIKELKKFGASLDIPDHKGRTPLHIAIVKGHHATAKLLCKLGANMSCRDKNNLQPICVAAEANALELVSFFIRNGVDPSALMNYRSNTFSVLEIKSMINSFCTFYGLDLINPNHPPLAPYVPPQPHAQYVYYNVIQMVMSRLQLPSETISPILSQLIINEQKLNIQNFSTFHSRTRSVIICSVEEIHDQVQQHDFTDSFTTPYSKCLLFLELINLFSSVEMMSDILSLRYAVDIKDLDGNDDHDDHVEEESSLSLKSFPINRSFPLKTQDTCWKFLDLTLIERYIGGDTSCYVSTQFLASLHTWLTSIPRGDHIHSSSAY
jgi:ankyrin repeat protein